MAHTEEMSTIVKGNPTICRAIVLSKGTLHEDDETSCKCFKSAKPQPLVNLLYNSPYKTILLKSAFVEVNKDIIGIMNRD